MGPRLGGSKPQSWIHTGLHQMQSGFMKDPSRWAKGSTSPGAERPQPLLRAPIVSRSALQPMKEISLLEVLLRAAGRITAVSGVIALLVWLTWVMLDVKNMQSGFTLPY